MCEPLQSIIRNGKWRSAKSWFPLTCWCIQCAGSLSLMVAMIWRMTWRWRLMHWRKRALVEHPCQWSLCKRHPLKSYDSQSQSERLSGEAEKTNNHNKYLQRPYKYVVVKSHFSFVLFLCFVDLVIIKMKQLRQRSRKVLTYSKTSQDKLLYPFRIVWLRIRWRKKVCTELFGAEKKVWLTLM